MAVGDRQPRHVDATSALELGDQSAGALDGDRMVFNPSVYGRFANGAVTHSIIMRSKSGTVREIDARHNFLRKTGFTPTDR